jgi:uncharacterized RDD family membrane protein YckC
MTNAWYYARGQRQLGPVPLDELRALLSAGQVQGQDLVWTASMASWAPASSVAELADVARPALANLGGFSAGAGVAYGALVAPGTVPGMPPSMAGMPIDMSPDALASPLYNYYTPPCASDADVHYAGFWIRVVAVFIDCIVCTIIALLGGFLIGALMFGYTGAHGRVSPDDIRAAATLPAQLTGGVLTLIYFAWMESSARQATFGKQALGLFITDTAGRPITFIRAAWRYHASLLPLLVMLAAFKLIDPPARDVVAFVGLLVFAVGCVMVGVTPRKQGLHDLLARTLVYRRA